MNGDWFETTLGEAVDVVNGGTPSTSNDEYWGGEIVWITTTELTAFDGGKVSSSKRTLTSEGLKNGPARLVRKGTTLVGTTATVGTCAIASCDLAFNQQISGLIPKTNELIDNFLLYLVQHKKAILEGLSAGTSFKRISTSVLKTIPLSYPSIPEQKRIVDLISSVDKYMEDLEAQLDRAKLARSAVLHELLSAGGDDWVPATIGDISSFISERQSPEQLPEESIYVGLEHLEPKITSVHKFDSTSRVTSSLTPFEIGDVLFGRLRPYLHKVALSGMQGFCSPEILVLRANSKVLPQMLLLYCNADSTIQVCVERSAGTRMPRTSTRDLASIEVQLPPIREQEKLAGLFVAFDGEITQLINSLEKTGALKSGLLSELLSGDKRIPESYDRVMSQP